MQTKNEKRIRARQLIREQLERGIKPKSRTNPEERPYTPKEIEDKKNQLRILEDRLAGIKRKAKKKVKVGEEKQEDEWEIQIYRISYAYIKNSVRRKNKGGSKKKMKNQKSVTLVQTVKNRPGAIVAYRNGLMGISPKNHSFRLVKKETNFN